MQAWHGRPRHSDGACEELLGHLLLEPSELLEVLAPEGWERSPLRLVFHPTAEQLREERERIERNLASWFGGAATEGGESGPDDRNPRRPRGALPADDTGEPTRRRDEAEADVPEGPTTSVPEEEPTSVSKGPTSVPEEPEREVIELLGRALWDVFSDNHTVVDSEGVAYDLGSFRGSGGFIAEMLNERYPLVGSRYHYLDFYMGSALVGGRADLGPVYRWIFSRLEAAGCDWIYSFPRLHLIDLQGAEPRVDDELAYDPSEAVRADLERAERTKEVDALAARLDEAYEEAVRRAREESLPPTVAAYRDVFGTLPAGWPYPDM